MSTLTPQNKSLAGAEFDLSFQDSSSATFQDGSIYIILKYAQAFLQLFIKD